MNAAPGEHAAGRALRIAVLFGLGVALSGCANVRQMVVQTMFTPRLSECRGFDVPLSTFVGSSRKELRVKVRARRIDHDFPFVVETSPDTFVLVAFTPLGTKSFTLVRRGNSVEIENLLGPGALPVPPRNVMEDLLAMSVPSACSASSSGVVTTSVNGWNISDACEKGRPVSRQIGKPDEPVEIDVAYSMDGIVVRQNRCRYDARYVLQGMPDAGAANAAVAEVSAAAAAKPLEAASVPEAGQSTAVQAGQSTAVQAGQSTAVQAGQSSAVQGGQSVVSGPEPSLEATPATP